MSEETAPCDPAVLRVGPVTIPYLSRGEAVQRIHRAFLDRQPIQVAFCNANMLLKALRDADYASTLKHFLILNDGLGIDLCSRLFSGRSFRDNLNGTDLTPEVLRLDGPNLRVYLLGGAPGTAEAAKARLLADYPRHSVVGTRDGYFSDDEFGSVVDAIAAAEPDLLLVGMGNPRQERFIVAASERLDIPVVMAVGAFLDFTAGNVVRAPAAIRAVRAEWLFRLAQEPRRLGRRYTLDIVSFLWRIALLRAKAGPAPRMKEQGGTGGGSETPDFPRRRTKDPSHPVPAVATGGPVKSVAP